MKPYKLALLLFLIAFITSVNGASSLDNPDCSDFEFIFARGSGQSLNDTDYNTFRQKVNEVMKNKNIKYNFYELGTKNGGYSAFSPNNAASILGTYLSAGESYEFGESVENGVKELISRLKTEVEKCKNKKFILSGYSQGAFVIDKTLPYLNSDKIFYVATFGDPKLYLPEGKNACKNIGLSSYRVYVPDCEVSEGVFGGMNPYEDNSYKEKRGAWCNQNDFICGSKLNITNLWKGHTSYVNETGYERFAKIISEKILKIPESNPETTARYSDGRKRDIVVVYDFDNKPMSDKFKNLLISLSDHSVRISVYNLYTFLDSTKVLEEMIPFTNDGLEAKLKNMEYKNSLNVGNLSSGGNNLFYAVKELARLTEWNDGSGRNIYLFSNKLYGEYIGTNGVTVDDAIKAAKDKNIKVSLLSENGLEENTVLQKLTWETGGKVIGSKYEKVVLNQNETTAKPQYFSKTYQINQDSKYTLVIINETIYGVSDKKKLVIRNLDKNRINNIMFVGYNESGEKINQKTFHFGTEKAPDSGKVNF